MHTSWLTTRELATFLHVSIKTIRRAYRKGVIPVERLGRMVRFDLAEVRRAMKRNGRSRMRRLNGTSTAQRATGGARRRCAQRKAPA